MIILIKFDTSLHFESPPIGCKNRSFDYLISNSGSDQILETSIIETKTLRYIKQLTISNIFTKNIPCDNFSLYV